VREAILASETALSRRVVYSIGFAGHSAREFFGKLRAAGIRQLVDARLRNRSQLAGFAKQDDLAFFLRELCDAEYWHEPLLAPTPELFTGRRGGTLDWPTYAARYMELLRRREVHDRLEPALLRGPTVVLCSEHSADQCHRRLALEYLAESWDGFEIVHL
jgi:uncharacterized protein (DUF488 family)